MDALLTFLTNVDNFSYTPFQCTLSALYVFKAFEDQLPGKHSGLITTELLDGVLDGVCQQFPDVSIRLHLTVNYCVYRTCCKERMLDRCHKLRLKSSFSVIIISVI